MKYVIYVDYAAGKHGHYLNNDVDYIKTDAKDICEAIEIAEQKYREFADDIYLIRIMEKSGKVITVEKGLTHIPFTAIMCKRSEKGGWHRNTSENFENNHVVHWCRFHNDDWFECQ